MHKLVFSMSECYNSLVKNHLFNCYKLTSYITVNEKADYQLSWFLCCVDIQYHSNLHHAPYLNFVV